MEFCDLFSRIKERKASYLNSRRRCGFGRLYLGLFATLFVFTGITALTVQETDLPDTEVLVDTEKGDALLPEFGSNFLSQLDCAGVRPGQVLSKNPYDKNLLTNQVERQAMVWKRILVCVPEAMALSEKAFAEKKDSMSKKEINKFQKEVKSAENWLSRAVSRYINKVVQTLTSPKTVAYKLGDGGYTWTYPGHAIRAVKRSADIMGVLDGNSALFSDEMIAFLTPKGTSAKSGKKSDETFVKTGSTFFDPSLGMTQEQFDIAKLVDDLHTEDAVANICSHGMVTETPCSAARSQSQLQLLLQQAGIASGQARVPIVISYSTLVAPHLATNKSALCESIQRAGHAHHHWFEGVVNGHTSEGFNQAWYAGLGHSLVHLERTLGRYIKANDSTPADRIPEEIRKFTTVKVPGLSGSNFCTLNVCDEDSCISP